MGRILIVDDNAGARAFASASLRHLGHELQEVVPTCLFEVLRLLHEDPPALAECVQQLLRGETLEAASAPTVEGLIAIVDDSRLTRTYLANCLRGGGLESVAIVPVTLESVLGALKEARLRLLLLDYQMPHFTGEALVQVLSLC